MNETNDSKWISFSKKMKKKIQILKSKMIGPIEKGMEKARLEVPPEGEYEGVDLSVLPKFISYKAALLKEKMTLKYVLLAVVLLASFQYLASRIEIASLHKKLREKEYILAPGVLDFTTASPQSVPDSYVNDAVMDFLLDFGNVSSNHIEEQYHRLKGFMSDDLKIQFDRETAEWINQVKTEDISQILKVTEKEIKTNEKGAFQVVALGRAEFYTGRQYLGHEDQVIEMVLKLVPPEKGKRWYLQITSLSWSKQDTFRAKSKLSQ